MGQHGYRAGLGHFWWHDYFRFGALDDIILPTWQHLWFVVYLWVYTLIAAAVLAWVPERARTRAADGAARMLGGWGMLVVPTLLWLGIWGRFRVRDETPAVFDAGSSTLHYLIPFGNGWLRRVGP